VMACNVNCSLQDLHILNLQCFRYYNPASGMLLEDLLIENCLQSRDIWGGGNFDF